MVSERLEGVVRREYESSKAITFDCMMLHVATWIS